MITVPQAREMAGQRLLRKLSTWATTVVEAPAMSIGLRPPTEREVRADEFTAESWVREWDAMQLPAGAEVDWETRTWRSIGRQQVPVRLRLRDPGAVAAFARGESSRRWRMLTARVAGIHAALGASDQMGAAVRRHSATLVDLPSERFDQVVAVSDWLCRNDVKGLRPRQLPIRGVDSKWFGAHRAVVSALVLAASSRVDLGLVDSDPLVRVRVLDPTLAPGGVNDFAASREQLHSLRLDHRVTFVFENLESVLAMPPWSGAVVVHGSGYAVDVVGGLPWLRNAPVIYWGDLDTDGFAILHRLRTHLPDVVTALMDVETLLAHRDLWVPDHKPASGRLPMLTRAEQMTCDRLAAEGNVRLEQERIPWGSAVEALRRADSKL